MKISTLRKLRTWCLRKRALHEASHAKEEYGPMNLYRPRLAGRMESLDAVVDRIDAILKSAHDKWHDRKKKCSR